MSEQREQIPVCPLHGPMKKVAFEQYDRVIGIFWFCVNDDPSKPDYCDNCEDCDDPLPEPKPQQLSFIREN